LHAGGSAGTLIDSVPHPVMIRVHGAADRIHLGALRGLRTAVGTVPHAVLVTIVDGTAGRIDLRFLRSIRALVLGIGHAVAVAVGRAAGGVDLPPLRGVGALVDAVGYAVGIAVLGAAGRVDHRPLGSAGALVLVVGHAILVGVGGLTAADRHEEAPADFIVILGLIHRATDVGLDPSRIAPDAPAALLPEIPPHSAAEIVSPVGLIQIEGGGLGVFPSKAQGQ